MSAPTTPPAAPPAPATEDSPLLARIHDAEACRALLVRLLERLGPMQAPPEARRVFVNRTLRLDSIRYVGFDLDWTLAPYYRLPLEELTFRLALDHLIEHKGYPDRARMVEFRPHFPHRGLIVDREKGTVLKMNRHRYVVRAYLGRRPLGARERADLYRRELIDLSQERFYRADTLFELAEVNLFAELMELALLGDIQAPPPPQLFADVREAVDSIHANGALKSVVSADLPRFLPRDPELLAALERLRLGGRKLLLITNSEWYYTRNLCRHLFDQFLGDGDDAWLGLFSLVIVRSRKPGFFRKKDPFVQLDVDGNELGEVDVPAWGGIYEGGNREGLMKLLDVPGEQVLYVGDHIYGDVVSTKLASTWRTALIVSELEDELSLSGEAEQRRELVRLKRELAAMSFQIDSARDLVTICADPVAGVDDDKRIADLDQAHARLAYLEADHRALRARVRDLEARIAMRHNPTWGSVFREGGSKSLFGSQVEDFACLYTSRVANFALYGTHHFFRVLEDPLAHEAEPW